MSLTATEVVRRYYDAYSAGNLDEADRWVSPQCEIDEPDFLPYGRIPITGAREMFDKIGGTFFTLFKEDTQLIDTIYFENGNKVITNAVWIMTGRFTNKTIRCHYQEYFEVEDDLVVVMRPFYHSAADMIAEMAAARAAGVQIAPWEPLD